MRTAVIDVGSNSVRLVVFDGDNCGKKHLITSRLGEGIINHRLAPQAIERTARAILEFKGIAEKEGVDSILAFATEAVRRAENRQEFLSLTKELCGIEIDVVDGQTEALLAVKGALFDGDGCVIDLGGASTEIAVQQDGKVVYAVSAPVGAVTLSDACGRDEDKIAAYIADKTRVYGDIPPCGKVFAVGGTATSLAACVLGLDEYDSDMVHGTEVASAQLDRLIDEFRQMTTEQIYKKYAVDRRRAEIVFGGAILLRSVLVLTKADRLTVSENDNLNGYYNLHKQSSGE